MTMQIILQLVLTATLIINSIRANQQIQEGPLDQQAKLGEQVILRCKIKNLKGEPQWCIDDFCLGISKKDAAKTNQTMPNHITLKGRPRHRIIGDKSKGEFHLLIEPIQLQDNMFYYCMATAASETVKAIKSKKVFLTVLTYPQSLNLDNPVHVSLNKPSSIQCSARQSRPPVKILIAINGNLIADDSKYKTEIIQIPISMSQENSVVMNELDLNLTNEQNKKIVYLAPTAQISVEQMRESFYDTITTLSMDDINMRMEGQTVECFVHSFVNYLESPSNSKKISNFNLNSFHNNMMNTKSIIQVDYAPEVTLKVLSANRILKEEDVISLVCETKATPAIQTYKWYIGKNYLNGVGDSNLNLKLRREMHLKTVTCEASNTVASVKASIQLNILYKPSFIKGTKSFLLVDKNACNKPLTLDCQVNSNPSANITWYRRRINNNKVYQFVLDKKKLTSLFTKIDINSPTVDENTYYFDELIGTGPTYTIASFNCANLLTNLKNRTLETKSIKAAVNQTDFKTKITKLHQRDQLRRRINSTTSRRIVRNIDEEDEDVDTDYIDPLLNENSYTEEDDSYSSSLNYNDYNDFGIYICEATNKFAQSEQYSNSISRRYIKLNPVGAPVLKAMPSTAVSTSSTTSNNNDDIIAELMKAVDAHLVEVTATIGSSVSLICIVEPLPQFHTIVWMNEFGKLIPNSKYSIFETIKDDLNTQTTAAQQNLNKARIIKNIKIKYENLTLFSSKSSNEISDHDPIEFKNEGLITNEGDVNLMRSILYIKTVREQDLGVYKCKSSNSYGSHTVSILLREKTLMDKFNLNNYLFLTLTTSGTVVIFILIILTMICLVSGRARRTLCCCCCCCCFKCAKKILKDKDLLAQNLNCEQNSDKSINEWLVSSKLSNDTATGSLINSGATNNNNISTTTAMSLLNNNDLNDHINMNNLMNTLTNQLKSNKMLLSTPSHLRLDLNANCDDLDDDLNMEKNRLFLTTETTNNTFKRDENRSSSQSYHQSSQFNRYLVSSPLLSTSSQKDSSEDNQDKCDSSNTSNTTPSPSSTSTAQTGVSKTMASMMLIRSPQNFNAKISTLSSSNINESSKAEQQRLLGSTPIKLNSFMFKKNFETLKNEKSIEKDYYENTTNLEDFNDNDDLSKILQDTTYRLSDLFNELSPSLIVNKQNSSSNYMPSNLSVKTNLFQKFPSLNSASPPPPPPPPPQQLSAHSGQVNQSRQALLQAINSNSTNQSNFNKFPIPFSNPPSNSNTSKFYTNFYRNPNLANSTEHYENNTDLKQNSEIEIKTTQHVAKITTTCNGNGNKYQTVV